MRVLVGLLVLFAGMTQAHAGLRAGAAVVDITPRELPVVVNGGFLTREVEVVADRLHSRAIVLSDGEQSVAIAVVDSCMVPTKVCDSAKRIASEKIGIPAGRILIAATHTHSAPSSMDMCLGTDRDPKYTAFLPGAIGRRSMRGRRSTCTKTRRRRWSYRRCAWAASPSPACRTKSMRSPV